ncbi:MAG TPA: cyclic pyranopterin monophosphate synthase MoaC [Phaeodactylibacter sp.]|nr:cyclic pyranopterin monophosphate synthase MoaC [Phaeodactylibacter sp.]
MDLSHINKDNKPSMVDVGEKPVTLRIARAQCYVDLPASLSALLEEDEIHSKKGPVFQTAMLAGVMAAKKTGELIPLCHPLGLDQCTVDIRAEGKNRILVSCTARLHGKTGVEMEALTGASVAALTIYDMLKALSHDIRITDLQLMEKSRGKRDFHRKTETT